MFGDDRLPTQLVERIKNLTENIPLNKTAFGLRRHCF